MRIGILSDTHDLMRPEVADALAGCEAILHAGDVCDQRILNILRQIAPVHAALGNNDWMLKGSVPRQNTLELAGKKILLIHIKSQITEDVSNFDLVITGHTHRYNCKRVKDTIFLNPGSCGRRHFTQPITLALAELDPDTPGADGIVIAKIDIPHPERQ